MTCKCNCIGCTCTINQLVRKLFTEHAVYTKFFIESALYNLPDVDIITKRLLQNQIDIGQSIGKFVGSLQGDKLAKLLTDHILLAASAITASKTNDKTLDQKIKELFKNSKQVAKFLSNLNPSILPFNEILKMFNQHNQYVLDITTLNLQKNFKQEYITYDKYYEHMLMMADLITDALPLKNLKKNSKEKYDTTKITLQTNNKIGNKPIIMIIIVFIVIITFILGLLVYKLKFY